MPIYGVMVVDEDEQTLDSTEDLDEDNEDQNDADSGSDNSAPPDATPSKNKSEKRVNDLMSKWQTEQSRANQLQAELDALRSGKPKDKSDQKPASDAGADEFVQFARENTRTTLFNSDPRLAEFGLTADDIAGDTVAEMRASLAKSQKWISTIQTKARQQVLEEHGLDPEISTGSLRDSGKSFSTMSEKEFNEFLAERDSAPRL